MARITPAGAGKTFSSKRSNANCEDHPRRCGENLFVPDGQEIADGSPPQVRGKQLFTGKLNSNFRITPAGAGKTAGCVNCALQAKDHPRRCGENTGLVMSGCAYPGSPPQVRGKPAYCWTAGTAPRITPAGAGKTNQRRQRHEQQQDHPRRCGENLSVLSTSTPSRGSPPQVRGKLSNSSKTLLTNRITPAGAGKTSFSYHAMRRSRDHPRRCGENRTDCYDVRLRKGSPPQVRGKLLLMRKQGKQKWDHPRRCGENIDNLPLLLDAVGSPPQVRGKLSVSVNGFNLDGDHPRRCGENKRSTNSCRLVAGSPPQVRGKPAIQLHRFSAQRITPAGAGKTCRFGVFYCVRWDHPRRCGENIISQPFLQCKVGSPPQVRGKRKYITAKEGK